jgi:ribonuclease HI
MGSTYTLYFDGACGPMNPGGTASYGYVLSAVSEVVDRGTGVVGKGPDMSCNVAEYAGLRAGLESLLDYLREEVTEGVTLQVFGDSQLVIHQMVGKWKVKKGLYKSYYDKAFSLLLRMRARGIEVSFTWIPREKNQECDILSKLAPELEALSS